MISIITPVYNGERFIEACIKVVIEQNSPNVEHIIIDGGSTDKTVEVIKQYAEIYPHIRWISEKDQGQSDAMNKGIAMAKGEILSILNVDDYYEPNVLNRVSEIFKTLPEPSLLVGNCNVWEDGDKLRFVNKPKKLKFKELLLVPYVNIFPMNPSAYFYHTSLHQKVGLYDVEQHYTMDYDFILKTVLVVKTKYVDEIWGNYRLIEGTKTRNDEISGQGIQRLEQLLNNYRKKLSLLEQVQVALIIEFNKKLLRLKHYSNKPREILPNITTKVMKVFKLAS
jgi:glycosyltransferase involved in cell wall biosynthesis